MENEQLNIDYDKIEALYLNKKEYKFPRDIEIFEGKLGLISYLKEPIYISKSYSIEPKPFIINENGQKEEKSIPLERFIRFRLDENKKLKSNAKLVEWSDGSMSLFIGKKYYNITTQKLMNCRIGVKIDDELSLVGLNIPNRMTASLTEEDAINSKKYKEDETSKVKITYANQGNIKIDESQNNKFLNRKRKFKK